MTEYILYAVTILFQLYIYRTPCILVHKSICLREHIFWVISYHKVLRRRELLQVGGVFLGVEGFSFSCLRI